MSIQTHKRIANALRVLLSELKALESRVNQAQVSDARLIRQIAIDWIELRTRISKFEPEALAFVVFKMTESPLDDSDIQTWLAEEKIQKMFIESNKAELEDLRKVKEYAKSGSEEKRQGALSYVRSRIRVWIDQFELNWIPILDSPVAAEEELIDFFPESVLNKLPSEVQTDIGKAQSAFRACRLLRHQGFQPIFEAVGMYLRKALETAIILRFKQDAKENSLYDKQERMYGLKKLLELAKSSKFISPSLHKEVKSIKWLGDVGVHDYKVSIQESDIKPAFKLIRFALEHLFTKSK